MEGRYALAPPLGGDAFSGWSFFDLAKSVLPPGVGWKAPPESRELKGFTKSALGEGLQLFSSTAYTMYGP